MADSRQETLSLLFQVLGTSEGASRVGELAESLEQMGEQGKAAADALRDVQRAQQQARQSLGTGGAAANIGDTLDRARQANAASLASGLSEANAQLENMATAMADLVAQVDRLSGAAEGIKRVLVFEGIAKALKEIAGLGKDSAKAMDDVAKPREVNFRTQGLGAIKNAALNARDGMHQLHETMGKLATAIPGTEKWAGFLSGVRTALSSIPSLIAGLRNLASSLGLLKAAAAIALGLGALAMVAKVVGDALEKLRAAVMKPVQAAAAMEEATIGLNFALQANHGATAGATQAMVEYAKRLAETSRYSDESIVKTQALIAGLGGLGGAQLQRATRDTLDFAAAVGADLETIAFAMAKATSGQTELFSRYGMAIDEAMPRSERFAAVLQTIESRFSGAAAAQVRGYSGALAQLHSAWNELLATLGRPFLVPLARGLNLLTSAVHSVTEHVGALNRVDTSGAVEQLNRVTQALDHVRAQPNPLEAVARGMAVSGNTLGAAVLQGIMRANDEVLKLTGNLGKLERGLTLAVKTEVKGGDIDSALRIAQALDGALAAAAASGQLKLFEMLTRVRAEAQAGIRLRVEADTAEAKRAIDTLRDQLAMVPTGKLLYTFDPAGVREADRAFAEFRARLKAQGRAELGLDTRTMRRELDEALDGAGKAVAEATAAGTMDIRPGVRAERLRVDLSNALVNAQNLAQLKVDLGLELKDADEAQVQERIAKLNERIGKLRERLQTLGDVKPGDVRAELLLDEYQATQDLRKWLREFGSSKATVEVETQGLERLNTLRASLATARAEATKRLLKAGDLADAKTVEQALAGIEAEWSRLAAASRGTDLARGWNDLVAALVDARRQTPELAGALDAVVARLDKKYRLNIELQVKQADAEARVGALVDLAQRLRTASGGTVGEALGLEALRHDATATSQVLAAMAGDLEDLSRLRGPAELKGYVEAIDTALLAAGADTKTFDLALVSMLAQASDRGRALLAVMEEIDTALQDATAKRAQVDIELGNVDAARAELAQLLLQIQALPEQKRLEYELQVRGLQRSIATVARFGEEAWAETKKQFVDNMKGVTFDGLANAFSTALLAMGNGMRAWTEAMRGVFRAFTDAVIQEMARLAAFWVIKSVVKWLTGGVAPVMLAPTPAGQQQTAGGTAAQRGVGLPQPGSYMLPRAIDFSAEPLLVRLNIADPPEQRVMPRLRMERPQALNVAPRWRAVPSASLAARPSFRAQEGRPLPVRPTLRLVQPRPLDVAPIFRLAAAARRQAIALMESPGPSVRPLPSLPVPQSAGGAVQALLASVRRPQAAAREALPATAELGRALRASAAESRASRAAMAWPRADDRVAEALPAVRQGALTVNVNGYDTKDILQSARRGPLGRALARNARRSRWY